MASYSPIPRPGSSGETKEFQVQESRVTADDGKVSHSLDPRRKRSLKERLGSWEIGLLIVSTTAIVLAVIVLSLLWECGINQPRGGNKVGHAIIARGWAIKATTLSAMVIRAGVAVQAAVCTSLAASLLLEGNGVPLPDVLHFAALRSVSTAPPTILYPIFRRFKLYRRSAPTILIIIVFLTATACQLSSTILVLDMRIWPIEGRPMTVAGPIGTDLNTTALQRSRTDKSDFWGARPLAYPTFGEYWVPGRTVEHAHDAGMQYRGVIPFKNATDRALRKFHGLTNVFASQVGCVAPKIEAKVVYNSEVSYRFLVGNATYKAEPGKGLLSCKDIDPAEAANATFVSTSSQATCAISFNCTIPYPNAHYTNDYLGTASNETFGEDSADPPPPVNEWRLGVCAIHMGSRWIFNKSLTEFAKDIELDGVRTDITMVLNHTDHLPRGSGRQSNGTIFSQVVSTNGEWATYDLQGDGIVDLSLCFTELSTEPRPVKMEAWSTYEAELKWDERKHTYDTWQVQYKYNSTGGKSTTEGRGIMDMDLLPPDENTTQPNIIPLDFGAVINRGLYHFHTPGQVGTYIPMCLMCSGDEDYMSIKVHPVTSQLFYDIVTITRHPALGLQSMFHSLIQSAYYEELPSYDVTLPIQIQRSQPQEYPCQTTGFMVVMLLLGIHVAMVATLVSLFAVRAKESLIGEIWHSVGQVMSDVPQPLLQEHIGKTEEEIEKAKLDERIVGLAHSRYTQGQGIELRQRV
ncbi:hypothetical protein FB567DRAFT_196303 [Paraphoma chrysanthemicola]|uniref:Uncharacterized protein n=1 Tax=Paraphoma chrysanthemicola TaxID=798071 RepID=A0A8K0VTW4_9PLEO|nr:hypothetical protein FB567DRAFT_196303 [Paraphoma chrysanthemicola]